MILDTSFLIDLMRRDPKAHALLGKLEAGSEPLQVPAPVFYELWEGVERSARPFKEEAAVQDVLEAYAPLDLTAAAARRAGRLSGALARRGQMVDDVDLLIGAMALEEGTKVVSRNAKDFDRMAELQILSY